MARIKYEAMAKTGTYTDREGQEKNRWTKVGVVFEGDKGLSLKIEAIPVAPWDGWVSLFEPKERDAKPQRQTNQVVDDEDGPPF